MSTELENLKAQVTEISLAERQMYLEQKAAKLQRQIQTIQYQATDQIKDLELVRKNAVEELKSLALKMEGGLGNQS